MTFNLSDPSEIFVNEHEPPVGTMGAEVIATGVTQEPRSEMWQVKLERRRSSRLGRFQ